MKPLYFLGLKFWGDTTENLLGALDLAGGLLVVPSAPSLAQMADDPLLRTAHQEADWAVVDGGYVALILRALGKKAHRISGLQLLEKTIDNCGEGVVPMKDRKILWVVPSAAEEERIQKYLSGKDFETAKQGYYQAPFYEIDEDFDDKILQSRVKADAPDWIILCLGGGRQEKLGYFLRRADDGEGPRKNGPVILGTGAAIAFFTGGQTKIPIWADRLYLGWFFRIIEKPKVFLPRYFKAFWHFPLLLLRERKKLFTEERQGKTSL
jgi:N-acetylglucosaminyldiphosphoundecaprenol N-acetyl-beta-D-mannosaminyltransferase